MTEPRFSVIIPVHNKARHVAESVASALAQTLPPHEVILIDDASTDGSAEIIAAFKHPRIRVLFRDTPGPGGYAARNLGIEKADGDWIAFLDADDIWAPTHLADIAAAIVRVPGVGCVSTRYEHVFKDRRHESNMPATLAAAEGASVSLEGFLRLWLETRDCPIWTGAAAFRRDVLVRAGLFPAGKAVRGGDKDLWLRAVATAPFTYVSRASAEFHRDSDNKVSKKTNPDTLPLIVETARTMIRGSNTAERALLRRLINQQIGLYARFSFKGERISPSFARNLYLPEGVGLYLLIEGLRLMPAKLRQNIYRSVKRV
ncbi:glycosyltransferase family A protein [Sphingomonas sp. LaA6.9]|uniref:glycosyltransferase family 2 protein n=1 Tax=Sphingomonas sp. LaA6.9 TaxID=2919914 RepID=UPI001F4F53EE|nr:glycosyltransferase family A protein [Sphingomonas sp. LaA6.9]MCJ8156914.1 glycosyltransferase family 2 protein [Sphingomonas sp. LaA6.9]